MVVRLTVWILSVLAVLVGACFALTDFDELQTTRRETFELPFVDQGAPPQLDILFVVDRPNQYDETMWEAMDGVTLQSGGMPESLGVSWDNGDLGVAPVELHTTGVCPRSQWIPPWACPVCRPSATLWTC